MKKIIKLCLIIICVIVTGCTKEEDKFEHYDLRDKDLNTYIYNNNNSGKEVYVLADITPSNNETCLTGLFYKVAENDYILLETLESNQKESYNKDYIYRFYNNKLYGIGNGNSPMAFEIELNGDKSELKEIEYQLWGNVNPFLVTEIKEINEDKIIYYGYAIVNESDSKSLISCSISTHECTIVE